MNSFLFWRVSTTCNHNILWWKSKWVLFAMVNVLLHPHFVIHSTVQRIESFFLQDVSFHLCSKATWHVYFMRKRKTDQAINCILCDFPQKLKQSTQQNIQIYKNTSRFFFSTSLHIVSNDTNSIWWSFYCAKSTFGWERTLEEIKFMTIIIWNSFV